MLPLERLMCERCTRKQQFFTIRIVRSTNTLRAQNAETLVLKLADQAVTITIETLGMSQSNKIFTPNTNIRDGKTRKKT